MSQKKVDAYKQKKINKGKATGRERVMDILEIAAWVFICVATVVWIGYSAYAKMTGSAEKVVVNTAMDTTALDNYLSGLSAASDDTEEEAVSEEETDDTAEDAETVEDAAADEETEDTAASDETEEDTAAAEETENTEGTETSDAEEDSASSDKEADEK